MATVKAYDVAASFLRALGAPVTPAMQRAVAIWLRFESGGTITGNNPWNLHNGPPCKSSSRYCPNVGNLPGQIGNRYAGPGDQNVAVFRTLDDGTRASARNLIRLAPSYGYGKVINEARSGDAAGFLIALQNSSWSAGHYSYSKLISAFRGSFNYNTSMTLRAVGGGSNTGPGVPPDAKPDANSALLGAWGDIVKFPVGHILTAADVNEIMVKLKAAGFFAGDSLFGGSETETRKVLTSFVGREWNKALQDEIQARFFKSATEAVDPLTRIAGVLETIGGGIGFLFDPQNWLYIIALGGGVALAGYGFSQLTGARVGLPTGPVGTIASEVTE